MWLASIKDAIYLVFTKSKKIPQKFQTDGENLEFAEWIVKDVNPSCMANSPQNHRTRS